MNNIFNFSHSYQTLGDEFFTKTIPAQVENAELIIKNKQLIKKLSLEHIDEETLTQCLAGNILTQEAIAIVYAGHQFGHFNPQLGDGRALLLGEITTKTQTYDIQLKGSGKTKYSRGGDGLLALGPGIREYLLSEYMYYVGVNTSRCLALVQTGTKVLREQPLTGAVLTRVLQSNMRIGTFEYFAGREDWQNVKKLADYAINRHYPHLSDSDDQYLHLLQEVATSHATTVVQMLNIGFIHGVLNTDNTTISGEIIDYGPCAFMDNYKANKVFSSIDRKSRYAYNNQANIIGWNLSSLGYCLSPFIDNAKEKVEQVLQDYSQIFDEKYNHMMANKLGLYYKKGDEQLIDEVLKIAEKNNVDYTNFFRNLGDVQSDAFCDEFMGWHVRWQDRLTQETHNPQELMDSVNPAFIPRNHNIEEIIANAYVGDFEKFYAFEHALKTPFVTTATNTQYSNPPKEHQIVQATFCGT